MLAELNTPLTLADGTIIDPSTGKRVREAKSNNFQRIEAPGVAQEIVARTRRSVAELPLPSPQMNILSVVLMYSMWGLSNQDIAVAIGTVSVEQVKHIKGLTEYKKISDDIVQSVMEHESNNVRTMFQQKASAAAEKIIMIAEEDEGVLGFTAAKDVLDRAGHRPADIVEHRHTMQNSLKIEYVKKSDTTNIPVIDLAPEDFSGHSS